MAEAHPAVRDPSAALEQLADDETGRALLAVAERAPGLWLVGGAVRDAMLGRRGRELDVAVEGDPLPAARALAADLGGRVTEHPTFGTASVHDGDGCVRVDLARTRRETYARPGALPDVEPAPLTEDLARRDFSVNAIAVALEPARRGEVHSVAHALDDLLEGRLRVLHDASFTDDPTRLLRLARYAGRLGFFPEEHTRLLAGRAVTAGALDTVSGPRVGAELRLALAEPRATAVLAELARLGLLDALHPRLRYDEALSERALGLLSADGRRDLLLLAAVALPLSLSAAPEPAAELRAWLDRLEFEAGERDRVVAAATAVPTLVNALGRARRGSELRAAAGRVPVEGIALAGALGPADAARRWLLQLRHVTLQIDGHDLLAAGIAEGPDIGRRLAAVLDLRLDGALEPGREAELEAALGA